VSDQAVSCPGCGAPYPARQRWDGYGFEYKSQATFLGWPLLHISFKYRPNRVPVVAKGVIAVGQFGIGLVNISQFGIGLFSVSQFTIAGYALAQFAAAYACIAQIGLYVERGYGQFVVRLADLLARLQPLGRPIGCLTKDGAPRCPDRSAGGPGNAYQHGY
jgi:hypothetical protein